MRKHLVLSIVLAALIVTLAVIGIMGSAQAGDGLNWQQPDFKPKTVEVLLQEILEQEEEQTKLEKKQLKELVKIRKALEK